MIFRPWTDELAPRTSVCTYVHRGPVVESDLDVATRGQEKEKEKKGEKEKERERDEGKVVA